MTNEEKEINKKGLDEYLLAYKIIKAFKIANKTWEKD